jgi:hypothetical protein
VGVLQDNGICLHLEVIWRDWMRFGADFGYVKWFGGDWMDADEDYGDWWWICCRAMRYACILDYVGRS